MKTKNILGMVALLGFAVAMPNVNEERIHARR